MRVPVSSSPHANLSSNPKLTDANTSQNISRSNIIINNNNNNPSLCYEPTSVLDLCRSPSPETKSTFHSTLPNSLPKPEPQDHALHNLDWDSIMNDLGLNHDDSVLESNNNLDLHSDPCAPVPEFPPPFDYVSDIYTNQSLGYNYGNSNNALDNLNSNSINSNNGFDFIEDLIRAADSFDRNHLQLAQAILERLHQRLRYPIGNPLHRATFYFKDALQSLLTGSNSTQRVSSMMEIVQIIRTFKDFTVISPIPMFSIFTTNQALLEALHGSNFMHIVDFDIGLGIQYASLMKEISEKVDSLLLRITAFVPADYASESRLIRENLNQFAHELRIRVQVEFVLISTFETLSFKPVKLVDGEKTAVLLSPSIFRRLGSANSIVGFLMDVRRLSPSVVVFVDGEGWMEAAPAPSFRLGVVNSLEFYSMMLESLDASMAGADWVKRIEMHLLRPKILATVEGAGRQVLPWREVFHGAGMRPLQLSQFADFQAECLLAKLQIRGFHVAKRQAELVLFWREWAMVATSAWRC